MPVHNSCGNASSKPLTLDEALNLSATRVLSPYQGMIVVTSLCDSCSTHVKQLLREIMADYFNYDFWTQHHHLDDTIKHVSTYALAHLTPAALMSEPNVLSLNIVLQATIICLHHAVITKAEMTKVSTTYSLESENQCMKAAMELSSLMRLVGRGYLAKVRLLNTKAFFSHP